jgi:flagellar hook-basal body complex protein FliE
MIPITPANISIPALPAISSPAGVGGSGGAFQSVLTDAISKVESFQKNADTTVNNFLNGEGEEIHHVALATQQADLSFQMFMGVRNKVVAAYNQVMQMQV